MQPDQHHWYPVQQEPLAQQHLDHKAQQELQDQRQQCLAQPVPLVQPEPPDQHLQFKDRRVRLDRPQQFKDRLEPLVQHLQFKAQQEPLVQRRQYRDLPESPDRPQQSQAQPVPLVQRQQFQDLPVQQDQHHWYLAQLE